MVVGVLYTYHLPTTLSNTKTEQKSKTKEKILKEKSGTAATPVSKLAIHKKSTISTKSPFVQILLQKFYKSITIGTVQLYGMDKKIQ